MCEHFQPADTRDHLVSIVLSLHWTTQSIAVVPTICVSKVIMMAFLDYQRNLKQSLFQLGVCGISRFQVSLTT